MIALWIAVAHAEPAVDVKVKLSTKGDDVSFDLSQIEARADRPLNITFVNRASADSGITHNVVVLMPGAEAAVIQRLADRGYQIEAFEKDPDVLGFGHALAPGASETLVVRFPGPGTYPYVCLMPGHADMMGMRGDIVVR